MNKSNTKLLGLQDDFKTPRQAVGKPMWVIIQDLVDKSTFFVLRKYTHRHVHLVFRAGLA